MVRLLDVTESRMTIENQIISPISSKRAILVNPPSPRMSSFVHLGIAYIGTILSENGWNVDIIDGSAPYGKHSFDSIAEYVNQGWIDFVGITVTTLFSTYAKKLINKIKAKEQCIKIVVGGPHATLMPEEMINAGADIVVRGEGEWTLYDLISYFNGKVPLEEIKGITFRNKEGRVINNPERDLIDDLDFLSFPNRDLFKRKDFIQAPEEYYRFSNIVTSRGCPFSCVYCSKEVFGKKFRSRSSKSIIDEIKLLYFKYGIQHVDFIDDGFTVNKQRVIHFCDSIKKYLDFTITWSCVTRVDIVDKDLLRLMKSAGCIKVNYGIESNNNSTLKRIKKGFTSERAKEVVLETKNVGLECSINFMWGFPWEDSVDIRKNRIFMANLSNFAQDIDPAGILIPFPGTEIYYEFKDDYNFDKWWIDAKKFTGRYREKIYKPLFRYFGFEDQGMLEENGFFNYSREIKNEIEKAALFITRHNLKIHNLLKRRIAFLLILLSRWLYLRNPRLEAILSDLFYSFLKIYKKYRYYTT